VYSNSKHLNKCLYINFLYLFIHLADYLTVLDKSLLKKAYIVSGFMLAKGAL